MQVNSSELLQCLFPFFSAADSHAAMQDICPAAMPEIELPKDVFPVLGIPQLKRIGTDK